MCCVSTRGEPQLNHSHDSLTEEIWPDFLLCWLLVLGASVFAPGCLVSSKGTFLFVGDLIRYRKIAFTNQCRSSLLLEIRIQIFILEKSRGNTLTCDCWQMQRARRDKNIGWERASALCLNLQSGMILGWSWDHYTPSEADERKPGKVRTPATPLASRSVKHEQLFIICGRMQKDTVALRDWDELILFLLCAAFHALPQSFWGVLDPLEQPWGSASLGNDLSSAAKGSEDDLLCRDLWLEMCVPNSLLKHLFSNWVACFYQRTGFRHIN